MFKFEPNITKEFLLSKNTAETYMEHYLGIRCQKGKLYKSPLRVDKQETCAFFVNKKGSLIFKDFRGDFYGDFISVVMYKFNCSYKTALKIVANDFGYIETKIPKNKRLIEYSGNKLDMTSTSIIQVELKEFTNKEFKWWKNYGISSETLNKFNVYSCKNVFLNGNLLNWSDSQNMVFGYYGGKKDDIELWRIYYPNRKKYRFLSNWSSKAIQGLKQLPKEGDILVITKSLKDVMTLYECGISAIAPNSESIFLTENRYSDLKSKFKRIILFYDNDLAGISSMNKIRKIFTDIEITFIPRKYKSKDISDFYKKYGMEETKKLINLYLNDNMEHRKIY